MRLLHAIRTVDPAGGGPIAMLTQLVPVVKNLGHAVQVISLDDPTAPSVARSPLPIEPLGPGRGTYGYSRRLAIWLGLHVGGFDAVVVHGLWQYHGFCVRTAARQAGVPYFVFPHGMLDPWFKQAFPGKHLKKRAYWRVAEHRILRDAAAVLFTTETEKLLARQTFTPYSVTEAVVAYGTAGPDGDPAIQRRVFEECYPQVAGRPFWLFLGRLHPKKGIDLLIDAYAEAGGDHLLVIAGPPEDAAYLETLRLRAAHLGVSDRIVWTGMLQGEEKWGALRAADAFVLPSHQENFGVAVAEALAAGTPVLISRAVNIWREIEADRAGLTGPDTREGTVSMMRAFLGLDKPEKQALRERALATFNQRFQVRATADSLVDIIRTYGRTHGR